MRVAVIDKDLCKPEKCSFQCVKVCPINRAGEKCCFVEDKAKINEDLCVGCGLCVKKCPFYAINVVNTPEQIKETPVHRFENNGFVLFRLPFPIFGKITGILGSNGTGKSTALKILSGELKPNFGNVKNIDLIKLFRGTEIQDYLEKLLNEKIKAVRKPQNIDNFSKNDILVKDLLKKADEKNKYEKIVNEFEFKEILEKKLNELSGGELQQVIIAAALLRSANVYYFDEPTSYLDIYQRLKVAKIIRKLASELTDEKNNPAVLVVDHDLAFLDIVADIVHISYGVPGAYGIFSKPYGIKVGINNFIDGYLKEDNLRIRKEKIDFKVIKSVEKKKEEVYLEWSDLEKKYPNFTLNIESGKIYKGEVIGVIGKNALGKTTFAKIIAGVEKQDNGQISKTMKISYKPQYITINENIEVSKVLSTVANINSESWKIEIERPLELTKLLEKNINELSGGELQRVAIALCLSRNADIYLLDEPSAFLDIEQRISIAKLLRKISETKECSMIVIDHDLLFLSYLADSCILFQGKSGVFGNAKILTVEDAYNKFLSEIGITFRKDEETGRPRANKLDSQKDREQKEKGIYFYI
ncbi:MAG: ribosome biogenesis/translation initiation ATPase RLI [Candidatus Aenigmatarchaeota archaeon]